MGHSSEKQQARLWLALHCHSGFLLLSHRPNEMKHLTVGGFDDELTRRIPQLASREGISLNRAALRLLRRGAGLGEPDGGPDIVGASLHHLIGTWTAEEAADMDRALGDFSHIDEDIWK